jgi:hypothetical protein
MGTSAVARKKKPAKGAAAKPAKSADFEKTFDALKKMLKPYENRCVVQQNGPMGYCLYTKKAIYQGKPLYFAGANIKKAYVSFYLMTVYGSPEERAKISPALKKRMQGKACFNFTSAEPELMKELAALVKSGSKRFLDVDELDVSGMKCD